MIRAWHGCLWLALVLGLSLTARANDGDSYRLFPRDVVAFSVYGEPDLNAQLRISGKGTINVPLLGEIKIMGLTLQEASHALAEAYIVADILLRPQVTLQVSEYSKKEVSVLGQIGRQGKVELPPETSSLSIVDVVSAAGGFTRIARSDNVRVTRRNPDTDTDQVFFVNVESMISGNANATPFEILPGDIIFVPERLF